MATSITHNVASPGQSRLLDRTQCAEQPRSPSISYKQAEEALLRRLACRTLLPASSSDQAVFEIVSEHNQPSTTAVEDLTTIFLADLLPNTRHGGKVLFARRIGGGSSSEACAIYAIEDEARSVELLFLRSAAYATDLIIPSEGLIAIKEPFCGPAGQRGADLCVLHPSDLVLLSPNDRRTPLCMRPSNLGVTATECKAMGNQALKEDRLLDALHHYTDGLALVEASEARLKADLLRNRSLVNLNLDRLNDALMDALESITDNIETDPDIATLNAKAHRRAARATYHLGNFEDAAWHISMLSLLAPHDEYGLAEADRIGKRLREERDAEYDFESITQYVSQGSCRIDAASFVRKVESRQTPDHGRGLFAKEKFHVCDLILCEKAVFSLRRGEPHSFRTVKVHPQKRGIAEFGAAYKAFAHKLSSNPTLLRKVSKLYANGYDNPNMGTMIDGAPVVDLFQIHEILTMNSFSAPSLDNIDDRPFPFMNLASDKPEAGINTFITASSINHSCLPNAELVQLGDLAVVRARRHIAEDEEVTICYSNLLDYEARQDTLRSTWNFECTCRLCMAESKVSREQRIRRQQLRASSADALTATTAQQLVDDIADAYNAEDFRGLPRVDLAQAHIAMQRAYSNAGDAEGGVESLFRALREYQIEIDIDGDEVRVSSDEWAYDHSIVSILINIALHFEMQGREAITQQLMARARDLYKTLNGVMKGWEKLFEQQAPEGSGS